MSVHELLVNKDKLHGMQETYPEIRESTTEKIERIKYK